MASSRSYVIGTRPDTGTGTLWLSDLNAWAPWIMPLSPSTVEPIRTHVSVASPEDTSVSASASVHMTSCENIHLVI